MAQASVIYNSQAVVDADRANWTAYGSGGITELQWGYDASENALDARTFGVCMIRWEGLSTAADWRVLALMRTTKTGTGDSRQTSLAARIVGTDPAQSYASTLSGTSNRLAIVGSDSTRTYLGSAVAGFSETLYHWRMIECIGTAIQHRWWQGDPVTDRPASPPAGAAVTDSTITAAGYCGMLIRAPIYETYLRELHVSTNGDPLPTDGGAPTRRFNPLLLALR